MHCAIVWITIALFCVSLSLGFSMRPTKTYERAMNASMAAEAELYVCRAAATNETFADMRCFEEAIAHFEFNASWAKQLGALYVTSAQKKKAFKLFNQSAFTILEANGYVGYKTSPNVSAVTLLKMYHVREGERGIELGKVWAKAFQLEHRALMASKILDDFLTWEADYGDAIDLYRDLGSIADVLRLKRMRYESRIEARKKHGKGKAKKMPEKQKFLAQLAEEIPRLTPDLASRYLSGKLTASAQGKNETLQFSRQRCGMIINYKSKYIAPDLVTYFGLCIAKWKEYKENIQSDGEPQPYGALMRNPLHSIAAFGNEFFVKQIADLYPSMVEAADNFGWLPMHWAVAHQNKKAVQVLLKVGSPAQLRATDAGGITPLKLGCINPRFRKTMETIAIKATGSPNPCGSFEAVEHIVDEEGDDDDDDHIPPGGNWKHAVDKNEAEHSCEFDIRNGISMSHHELVGRYLHNSKPVVLRDIIPLKTRKALMKNRLMSHFPNTTVRVEEFPAAEHYGGKLEGTFRLKEWLKKGKAATFANVEVSKKHFLKSAAHWVPDKIVLNDDEGYVTTDDTWPMISMAKENAVTNSVIRGNHEMFAVVHGVQHWILHTPDLAMSTSTKWQFNVTDASASKCTLRSGDILVIPQLWSGAYRSQGESVSVRRRMVWK